MDNKKISLPKSKRLFDIIFAFILLTITLPLFVLILIVIFIEHVLRNQVLAPLFYIEQRVSQGEKFGLIKFNIFKPEIIVLMKRRGKFIHTKDLEKDKSALSFAGRRLQKIYFDELPQIFNILVGDLTVVGPRPVNFEVYQRLLGRGVETKTVVKTGLTGLYQAHKGELGANQDKLDRKYISFCLNNPGWKIVLFDLKIILHTFLIIFRAQGI